MSTIDGMPSRGKLDLDQCLRRGSYQYVVVDTYGCTIMRWSPRADEDRPEAPDGSTLIRVAGDVPVAVHEAGVWVDVA